MWFQEEITGITPEIQIMEMVQQALAEMEEAVVQEMAALMQEQEVQRQIPREQKRGIRHKSQFM